MSANLGAHEVMELHEVLTSSINGINQFELYRPHVSDQQLAVILDRQIQFKTQDYNNMVQAISANGINMGAPYRSPMTTQPKYGLNNPQPHSPNTSPNQLDDRDISSGMLGCLKASAILKAMAVLECADPNLRKMIQQSAANCSEMAYEVWQYMNQKGYYQVPTMKQMTTDTMTGSYTTAPMGNMGQSGGMGIEQSGYPPQMGMQ